MDKRLHPITTAFFHKSINPLITSCYSSAGRPQRIRYFQLYCTFSERVFRGVTCRHAMAIGIVYICGLKKAVTEVFGGKF
jgi:hypothetical protein